jgi:outer membrane protein assembly factor BamB
MKGPAYNDVPEINSNNSQYDWSTYRHDNERSGFANTVIDLPLQSSWQVEVKAAGKLSSPTFADGKLFVADIDGHQLKAFDGKNGTLSWTYRTGGRIDSPPTIYKGKVIFGCHDGWVYCLRATDGELVWRFLAASMDLRHMSFEQLESVWPVHGSILILNDTAYCIAGRSMFLDGGLRLYQLDPTTGKQKQDVVVWDENDPKSKKNLQSHIKKMNMPVALSDILSSDGSHLFMRSQAIGLDGKRINLDRNNAKTSHLFSVTGFLDDAFWHRSFWYYGASNNAGPGGWYTAARKQIYGRLLAFNETDVFGFGRKPGYVRWNTALLQQFFSINKKAKVIKIKDKVLYGFKGGARGAPKTQLDYNWRNDSQIHVRGLVLAGKTLFMAGPKIIIDDEKAFENYSKAETQSALEQQDQLMSGEKEDAWLHAVSATDGEKLFEYKLPAAPVFDGMIVANNSIYIVLRNGIITRLCGK